ncbi:CIC11C00000002548 [Sungouiella intermedia]|uniref:CIC11C00000002548 n=1 Tax=Sungouiella intermedia TaxID=45354 RepID=A0A1L0GLM5_9ASCO|nr:CIC11C00000002548 [[Candida] intermedia]
MVRAYGPPPLSRARPYPYLLEVLESLANKKLLSEYTGDVKQWLSVLEGQSGANAQMIDLQPEVEWYMRPYLLDFLIELHQLFRLQPATLFLAINIIDRYCAKRIVFKRHYQLVGCTALWIAGKYEDKKLRVPTLRELAIMCRQAYDEEMFLQMEFHILLTLEWLLSHPLLEECLQLAIVEAGVSNQVTPCKYNRSLSDPLLLKVSAVTAVGRFFCELSLYDRFFLTVPTSLISISATLLACSMLGVPSASSYLKELLRLLAGLELSSQSTLGSRSSSTSSMSNSENEAPIVMGPFLLGLDDNAIATVRKIVLMLFLQTASLSDVLLRKYQALGVIPVIHNYSNRHPLTVQAVFDSTKQLQADDLVILPGSDLAHTADVLMMLAQELAPHQLAPPPGFASHATLPLTPPLATSLLVFSLNDNSSYTTPVLHLDLAQFSSYLPNLDSDWALPIPLSKTRI